MTRPLRRTLLLASAALALSPTAALAWGSEGHEIIADIARAYLSPQAKAQVDALLAADTDTLTAPDMASRATWADAYRGAGHRETASWHFVDIELDHPDLNAACFGFPAANGPASQGPAQDCVVDKVEEFERELADRSTPQPERILALVYLLHFVGDLHQPLHSSDNHDRGGNCVHISLDDTRTTNLHSYWDTTVVQALGSDPQTVADQLRAEITAAERVEWEKGDPRSWAQEAYSVARSVAFTVGSQPGCSGDAGPLPLPAGYAERAEEAAKVQLERAGVRLATELNVELHGTSSMDQASSRK